MSDFSDDPFCPREAEDSWRRVLPRITSAMTELLRVAPYRDAGLSPHAPADLGAIARAERRIGRALPPSYRSFLQQHDGWPRFYDGAALLGTRELGRTSYADLAHAVFEAAETPIPDVGPPSSRVRGEPRQLIPFGIDADGTTLFAFDPAASRRDGEMGVIAWLSEIGIRLASFEDFLEHVLELYEAELAAPIARSLSSPVAAPRAGLAAATLHRPA